MSHVRVIAGLSLLVLSSCSMFGSLSSKGNGKSKSVPSRASESPSEDAEDAPRANAARPKIEGPSVKVDDDDPPHVTAAIKRLDEMEQMIGAKEFAKYARESRDFQGTFLFRKGWADEKKHDAMKARLDALDTAAFAAFGGRLAKVGDARRLLKLDSDAVEAVQATVDACEKASKLSTSGDGRASAELTTAIAAYEKAMARAIKLDENALHYYGERTDNGTVDVPTKLMECEVALGKAATQFADEYAPEVFPYAGEEPGCGVVEWTAAGVRTGSNQFAPYSRAATYGVTPVPCKSLVKRSKFPKALAGAVAQFAEHVDIPAKDIVQVAKGKPAIEVNKEDLHTYRFQDMRAYSKTFKFTKNPCGDKLFCEGGGSQAMGGYNRLEFSLERAAAHAGNKPDLCRNHLKAAKSHADWFVKFHAEAVAEKEWVAGATYKTKKGVKLSEKQLIAAFAEQGQLAEDRLDEKYCNKPAK